jgi:hypothetical protein
MSSNKKCPKCDIWNEDLSHCSNCNELLDYWKIRELEVTKKEKTFKDRPLSDSELFFKNMKYSRFLMVKAVYYIFYSIWAAVMAIVSFFLMMIAYGPG